MSTPNRPAELHAAHAAHAAHVVGPAPSTTAPSGWREGLAAFAHPRVVTMLFLGFSAGVPILLIFSSLSLWLREAGVEKSAVTYFSWAALGYSFKFVWAPLVDRLSLPLLTRTLGRRRGWLLLSQIAVAGSILWMASIDPAAGIGGAAEAAGETVAGAGTGTTTALTLMAFAAVALGFSSATQDIVIDAYRVDSAGSELQALMSSTYVAGYRIGMIVAGAGALYLAQGFGSTAETYDYGAWRLTYAVMAAVMLVGMLTTLVIDEPAVRVPVLSERPLGENLRFFVAFLVAVASFVVAFRLGGDPAAALSGAIERATGNGALAGLLAATLRLGVALATAAAVFRLLIALRLVEAANVGEAYVAPVLDFFERYGTRIAWLLLALVGFYRVSDIVLGVIANVFYQDMGYTKVQIANVSKVFGLLITISGGFLGGLLAVRFGVLRILLLGAVLSALTNLLFVLLASGEPSVPLLYVVIGADNLSAGLAQAAFIAFLASLVNVSFTAVQTAIFTSIMTLFPKVLGGYSGSMVETIGYPVFFVVTALLTLPVIGLILVARRHLEREIREP